MEKTQVNRGRDSGLPLFFAGLAAGIAVTLLVAPLSGRGARRLIGRRVKDGEDWVMEKAAEIQEYTASAGAALRDRVRAATEPSSVG